MREEKKGQRKREKQTEGWIGLREKEWEGGLNERGNEDKADREKRESKKKKKGVIYQFNYFIVSLVISLEVKQKNEEEVNEYEVKKEKSNKKKIKEK